MGTNSWNGFEFNCLFANLGEDLFVDVARAAGCAAQEDGRGVGVADLNRDGRPDLVINNNAAAPTIYLNRLGEAGNWLQLELHGVASNRDGVGARVELTAGGRTLTRVVEAGSGYASQSEHVLHFGLGGAERVERLEIAWPSGRRQSLSDAALAEMTVNQRTRVVEPETPSDGRSGA